MHEFVIFGMIVLLQVRLIGYCVEGSLFLVYEYIENGNLSQHLRGLGEINLSAAFITLYIPPSCPNQNIIFHHFFMNGSMICFPGRDPLPWPTRVHIALDAARGLEYIHEHTVPVYIHRDIKSANILIDKNFRAKVVKLMMLDSLIKTLGIHFI